MLPSRGYFHDIQCPDLVCGRPYCHFGHRSRKKQTEHVEESSQQINSKPGIPTYKPTPKSELEQRSHIPISYVPDLVFRPDRPSRPPPKFKNKPVYKPTPINLLSSLNTSPSEHNDEQKEQIIEIKQDIANSEYDPSKSDINFEDLTSEFDQIDDILSESVSTEDILSENISKLNDDIKKEQDRLNLLLKSEELPEKTGIKDEENKCDDSKDKTEEENELTNKDIDKKHVQRSSSKGEKSPGDKHKNKRDKANASSEKIEKHSTESSCKEKESDNGKKEKSLEKSSRSNHKSSDTKHKEKSSNKVSHTEKDKPNIKYYPGPKEKSSKDKTERSKSNDKERETHRKEEKKDSSSSKPKEETKEQKDKTKSDHKDRIHDKKTKKDSESSETITESEKLKDKKKFESKEKSADTKKRKDSVDSETEKIKDKKKDKSKEASNSSSRKQKLKQKKRSRSRSDSRSKKEEKSHKSKKSDKERDKSESVRKKKRRSSFECDSESSPKRKKFKHDSSKKEKHRTDKESSKHSSSKSKSSHKSSREKHRKSSESSNGHVSDLPVETDIVLSDVDLDVEDEDETLRECYRIFNEYPSSVQAKSSHDNNKPVVEEKLEQIEDTFSSLAKKRVAHPNAEMSKPYLAPKPSTCKTVAPTPGQILANRYRVAKMAQADNEQQSIMNEVRQITYKAAPNLREAARLHKLKRLERERLKKEREKPPDNVVDAILNGTSKKPIVTGVKIIMTKKINAVPNVALIEKAKERISIIKQHRNEPVQTIAHTQKGSRVAHIPQVSLPDIPDVLQADKSKLPVNVRTRFLTLLADECFKLYSVKQDAYDRALNEEFACYEKCKVLATYRNSAMLAVNRLRKEIQERQSKNLGPLLAGESTHVDKSSDYHGKRFYDNVKKWLLSEEDLELHGYPRESGQRGKAVILKEKKEDDFSLNDENQRRCCRCSRIYQVDDDGWPLYEDDCMYHPLKKRTIRGQQIYLCCKSGDDTGCVTSDSHVSEAAQSDLLEGYQTTMPAERDNDPRSCAVYALDCEMCYTTKGLELTRVTVVDIDCKTVYESLVKPLNPIIDYNTRFSGITKDQMDRTSTNILQVQANILHLCNANTILVGHSLESDMKALKIVHSSVIDTAVLFPHKMGLPHKRALRSLASEYLRKIIQNDVGGHDSAEDAVTCMELIKWKLKEELKTPVKL